MPRRIAPPSDLAIRVWAAPLSVVITKTLGNGTSVNPYCLSVVMTTFRGVGLAARGNTLRFRAEAGGAERDAVDHDRPRTRIPAAEPFREGQLGRDRIGEPVVKQAERLAPDGGRGFRAKRPGGRRQPESRVWPVTEVLPDRWRSIPDRHRPPARRTT